MTSIYSYKYEAGLSNRIFIDVYCMIDSYEKLHSD